MIDFKVIDTNYAEAVKGIKAGWFLSSGSIWYDYIISLPNNLKITYLIVVLQNQVINGGFHQYFVNGYGQFSKETIDALIEISAFEHADLLKSAYAKVNIFDSDKLFREKLLKKDIYNLFVTDDLADALDDLDKVYYINCDNVTLLLRDYLINLNA